MANFLDALPFDFNDPGGRALHGVLAANYWTFEQIRPFVLQSGVKPEFVNWNQTASGIWFSVLDQAARQGLARALVEQVKASGDTKVAARLDELLDDEPVVAPNATETPVAAWRGSGVPERQTASEPTLLDITFLERGLQLAEAVVRLRVTAPSGKRYAGTGFFIAADLILTNHHVLFDDDHGGGRGTKVEAWFGYERDFGGNVREHVTVEADASTVTGAVDHDWGVVRINPAKVPPGVPIIDLNDLGSVATDERVYIIQHPNGGPKQIGMIHNIVRFVDDVILQYLTDTEIGSSGAPVFDEQWRLVGLHHQGKEVDLGGTTEIRNQGRRIERVIEGLHAAHLV